MKIREWLNRFDEFEIVDETNGLRLDFVRIQSGDLGTPPQRWEQCSREGRS